MILISYIMSNTPLYTLNLQLLTDNQNLYFEKINKSNSKKDSGFDLFVPESVVIPAGQILLINMKVIDNSESEENFKEKQNNNFGKLSSKKIGRNELCPCNSGKKYKHCHGSL